MKRYLIIDTHADEYSREECTYSMTVKQLINCLSGYPEDMPVLVGNNIQSYSLNDWYTYGAITCDRIIDVVDEDEEEEEDYPDDDDEEED